MHTLRDIIRSNAGVPIHANDNLSNSFAYSKIERSRDDAGGIEDDGGLWTGDRGYGGWKTGDGRRGVEEFTDDLEGVVGGHAISDEDLHALNWIILGKDGSKAIMDRVGFIADGKDECYEWGNLILFQ